MPDGIIFVYDKVRTTRVWWKTRVRGYAGTRICGYADMRVCGHAGMRIKHKKS